MNKAEWLNKNIGDPVKVTPAGALCTPVHDTWVKAADAWDMGRAEGIRLGMERSVKIIEQTPCKDLANFIVGLTPQDIIKSIREAMEKESK